MSIGDLLKEWEGKGGGALVAREYRIRLQIRDAARIAALVEMYPKRQETELISDLLVAALDELERAMPYIKGERVVAEDEKGDPIFEDVGPTPRFQRLARKHAAALQANLERE